MKREGKSNGTQIKIIFWLLSAGFLAFFVCVIVAPIRAAKAKADEMNCCNHIKDLAVEMRIYESDNGDTFPPVNGWCDALIENGTNQPSPRILSFRCPAASKKQTCGYTINSNLGNVMDTTQIPGDTVVLFESDAGWNSAGGHTNAVARHYGSRLLVAFADGSVKDVKLGELEKLRWIPATNATRDEVK